MIRRLPATLAAVVLTATVASGCSTFSKNSEAAKVDGRTLSVKDFEAISDDLAKAGQITAPVNGEFTGDVSRGVLSRWIVAQLLSTALAKNGTPIDAATEAKSETALKTSAGASWDTLSAATKSFLVTELSGQNALISGDYIPQGDAKLTYNAGLSESNTLCLRVIGIADQAAAQAAYQQILQGGDFASIADANNTDSSLGKGGVFKDSKTNSECVTAASLNQQVGQVLAQTPIGQPATPQAFSDSNGNTQYFIFEQRPWDEVADAATPIVRQSLGPAAERRLVKDGSAAVDSRYGMWDTADLTVKPSR
ncbi:MAG: Peptidylprolyl isomerase [Ilumatobacteraceae bacterium]|nr:Peptidylprolyl isomerase [Ilumatobacteraceae bacterium]